MRHLPTLVAAVLAGLFLIAGTDYARADAVAVTGIRLGVDSQRTRIVLDLSDSISPQITTLSGPDRLVIDLPKVAWKAPSTANTRVGLVKGFRFGQTESGAFRLVLDLTGPARIASKFNLPPGSGYQHRYVIDLRAVEAAPNSAENQPDLNSTPAPDTEAGNSAPAPKARPDNSASSPLAPGISREAKNVPQPARKPRQLGLTIVVDPGHGGVDPGTTGVDGVHEKGIVLKVAQKLRDNLKKTGYSVVMTRDSDEYLTLKARVEVARDAKADLFISLHADSNDEDKLRGASVYTLSDTASDAATAELAKKENGADTIGGIDISAESPEVSSILIELTMRETMNQSARFARTLLPMLGQVTPLLKNTHRFAGFRVLKAPDVPSVLVELGQLSNSSDEQRLTDDKVEGRIAGAISHAVDAYFALDQRADRGEAH
ncbi:MAG: N-acetylmuramoyl-L-alanine amidase [Alphaproteobacteria bacterium]